MFQAVAGTLEGDDFGVVDDAVDHGRREDLIAKDVAPAGEMQEARISQACSLRDETSWKNRFAESCSNRMSPNLSTMISSGDPATTWRTGAGDVPGGP
jgi:hypothetical protein